ncbi:MAG: hypothetical protein A2X57_10540 [Nitrospirae bacterium GWD2_57_8]|nr:MAG: hypothetical protein A2X57_10540 [Nitrospirae bacterium GWD2_57_8]
MDWKTILDPFLLSLIPIFVAVDPLGMLPIYVAITEGLKKRQRKTVIWHSILTAFLITVGFIFLGSAVFTALGILVEDFLIAGGILLLIIAVIDILRAGEKKLPPSPNVGVVPLGTPLIAGPAVLTTALVLVGPYGYVPVILALSVNLLLTWIAFVLADRIIKLIGINGARALAKIASLLLAAIAVKLIRSGIVKLLE